jgi:hypothetical protein
MKTSIEYYHKNQRKDRGESLVIMQSCSHKLQNQDETSFRFNRKETIILTGGIYPEEKQLREGEFCKPLYLDLRKVILL